MYVSDLKKSGRGSGSERSVSDLILSGEIRDGFDGSVHPLDGQERRQVGRVGRDDDEGEEEESEKELPKGGSTSSVRSCNNHLNCLAANLKGSCCPTNDGKFLECCS